MVTITIPLWNEKATLYVQYDTEREQASAFKKTDTGVEALTCWVQPTLWEVS
jgi:hypothetical protein